MSDFGDFEDDDAASTAPPDPEALVRFMVIAERRLSGDLSRASDLDAMSDWERALRLYVMTEVIELLVREWRGVTVVSLDD